MYKSDFTLLFWAYPFLLENCLRLLNMQYLTFSADDCLGVIIQNVSLFCNCLLYLLKIAHHKAAKVGGNRSNQGLVGEVSFG